MNINSDGFDCDFKELENIDYMIDSPMHDIRMGGITSMCPFVGCMPMIPKIMDDEFEDSSIRGEDSSSQSDILEQIENKNPQIFRTMSMYGIPKNTAKMIFKRMIKLTLMYK